MTTVYYPENRSFGNLQTALCALLAVGIHIALLSLDIPGKNAILTGGRGDVSLRVIHPEPPLPEPVERTSEIPRDSDTSPAPPPQKTPKNPPTVTKAPSPPEAIESERQVVPVLPTPDQKVSVLRKLDAVPPLSRLGPSAVPSETFEAYSPPVDMEKEGAGHEEVKPTPSVSGHTLDDDTLLGSTRGSQTPAESEARVTTYARPEYQKNRPPDYPRLARRRGYEGRTRLKVEVMETGRVGRIEIASSSGFEVLDEAALEAVKRWRFVPGTRDGKRISQWVVVPVRFRLD